jgi:hypothetical protein
METAAEHGSIERLDADDRSLRASPSFHMAMSAGQDRSTLSILVRRSAVAACWLPQRDEPLGVELPETVCPRPDGHRFGPVAFSVGKISRPQD